MPIALAWVDNSENESGFEIQRETQIALTWGAAVIFKVGADETRYVDTAVLPATYRYRVRSYNASGHSDWSDYATATIPEPLPKAPSGLTATITS